MQKMTVVLIIIGVLWKVRISLAKKIEESNSDFNVGTVDSNNIKRFVESCSQLVTSDRYHWYKNTDTTEKRWY